MFKIIRPNTITRLNNIHLRRNCNLKCNDRCTNLISEQNQILNLMGKQIRIITTITVVNFLTPLIVAGSFSVANLISKIMN